MTDSNPRFKSFSTGKEPTEEQAKYLQSLIDLAESDDSDLEGEESAEETYQS